MKRTVILTASLVALAALAFAAPAVQAKGGARRAGKRVNFFVNATKVGSARVSGLGAAQVERRGASFPAIAAGTRVKVKTAGGKLIVSGRF